MNRESFLEGVRLFKLKKAHEAKRRHRLKHMAKEHFRRQREAYQYPKGYPQGCDKDEIDELCGSSIKPERMYDNNYPELYLD